MAAITASAPLSAISANVLDFRLKMYSSKPAASIQATGGDRLTLTLTISAGYYDDGQYFANASHWWPTTICGALTASLQPCRLERCPCRSGCKARRSDV